MAVGGAVRVYLAMTATVIARDGVVYVTMARRMVTDWRGELAADYPLGFPFLIRCVHGLVGPWLSGDVVMGWQRSGQVVSLMFGVGSIVLVYMMARRLIGARGGLFAAWIWALLPQAAGLSADALTDVPTVTLMLGGVLAVMRGGMGWFFVAGLLSGVASTMRPEGGEVVLVGLGALGALGFKSRNVETSKRRNGEEAAQRHGGTEARRHGGEEEVASQRRGLWRVWAGASLLMGFGVIGGSYILLEGGRVLHKQTWMGEARADLGGSVATPGLWNPGDDCHGLAPAATVLRPFGASASSPLKLLVGYAGVRPTPCGVGSDWLSPYCTHPKTQPSPTTRRERHLIGGVRCAAIGPRLAGGSGVLSAVGLVIEKTFGSLNGVWMVLGTVGLLVLWARRGRGRYEKGFSYQQMHCDGRVAAMWWSLHAMILVWFASRAGYLSSRHCLVLDVCFVVMSGGVLAWVGEMAAARAPRSASVAAKRVGVLALVGICVALTPWLVRDIHEGRGSVREAAAWIARENGERGNQGIVAMDGWVPFYSGATRWADCATADGLGACAELGDSAWLVMTAEERPAERVVIAATGTMVELTEAARFGESKGRRGVVVYRVGRTVAN